jgi:ribosome-associated protein
MARKSPGGYYVDGEFVAADDAARARAAEPPSRTARKNASEELQKVGEALLTLRADLFAGLQLPEKLRDAIVEGKRLTNHGAKRRQIQFIGKLMRRLDADELEAVDAALRAGRGERPRPRDERR